MLLGNLAGQDDQWVSLRSKSKGVLPRNLGIFGTVFAFMQFFFSPILGSPPDRFGRRPIALLSTPKAQPSYRRAPA